jgi:hypothetical protein
MRCCRRQSRRHYSPCCFSLAAAFFDISSTVARYFQRHAISDIFHCRFAIIGFSLADFIIFIISLISDA